jgi:hypothetical protein
MLDNLAFKRSHLAEAYCDSLQGKGIANATSGLFLAGPRRVGKTTFLLEDLVPEAQKRQWQTIYVDVWANRLMDPALLIIEAVKAALKPYKNKLAHGLTQWAKRIQKVNILKIVELDFSKQGLPEHITLVDLLTDLVTLAGVPVLLIIDEAQEALTTEMGINAMFSIKSARDQINTAHKALDLMLVLTGSNRDKLAQLIIKKNQPFFGSDVTSFPLLGRDYTDFFTVKVNESLASNNQFDEDSVWEAFQLTGHRPEILRQMVGRTAINHEAGSFSALLKQDASLWHSQIWEEFESDFNRLGSLHQAILTLLIAQGKSFSPFSEESLQYYKKETEQPTLTLSSVQAAMHLLREQGFIWQSSRGVYALEDESFAEWFKHTQERTSE